MLTLHPPPTWLVDAAAVRRSARDLLHLLHPAARPTRRCCAQAATRTPTSSPRSASSTGSTSRGTCSSGYYMRDLVFHFDFGRSYQNNVDVREEIFSRLPATMSLALGGAHRLAAGRHPDRHPRPPSSAARSSSAWPWASPSSAISAPVYWLGLVTIYLFSKDIGRRPDLRHHRQLRGPVGGPRPVVSARCCCPGSCWRPRSPPSTRASCAPTSSRCSTRTTSARRAPRASASGASIFRHGVRSAVTPIVTIFGLDLGILFGGAILTETVFNIPGIGRVAVRRDPEVRHPDRAGDGAHRRRWRSSCSTWSWTSSTPSSTRGSGTSFRHGRCSRSRT